MENKAHNLINNNDVHIIDYWIENFEKQFKVEINGWLDDKIKDDGYNEYSLIDLNTAYKYIKNTEMKYNKKHYRVDYYRIYFTNFLSIKNFTIQYHYYCL